MYHWSESIHRVVEERRTAERVGLNVGRKRQHCQERISWIIKLNICHYV